MKICKECWKKDDKPADLDMSLDGVCRMPGPGMGKGMGPPMGMGPEPCDVRLRGDLTFSWCTQFRVSAKDGRQRHGRLWCGAKNFVTKSLNLLHVAQEL